MGTEKTKLIKPSVTLMTKLANGSESGLRRGEAMKSCWIRFVFGRTREAATIVYGD
jgi:hypothetical protein